ncbi:PDZ domain-containing protein [Pirellulaceae bacterium]|nr:PDZ domain-containing protein [Pirellulaceae bacterium]
MKGFPELMINRITFFLLSFSFAFALAPNGTRAAQVKFELDFDQAANHYVTIQATFQTEGKNEIEVFMPVWTPGSYLVREYSRNIETIVAKDQSGHSRILRKTKKNRWTVDCQDSTSVTVSYKLYCREMSVRTNWIEEDFGILNGAPTFLTEINSMDVPHIVKVNLPKKWKSVATALPQHNGQPYSFVAKDFDQLVDSPMLLGTLDSAAFELGGAQHDLVNLGGDGLWDVKKAAEDVKKIVAEHQKIWQTVPYRRYRFLNAIVETGGGLEHDNSTLMMTSRWSFGTRSRYQSWLGLVSHEFFHTWNIRRLRPIELVNYDFENESYFRTLWIAEGVTSYYDDLLVKRAGLSSEKEYLSNLSKLIRSLQTTAGRLNQSLSDSSFDTWIKFYRPDENSKNSQISYYTKGAVAAFLLDAEIRNSTNSARSLDDVMRQLYQQYAGPKGYSSSQFRKIASEVAGKDLKNWFATVIDSTKELDFSTSLATYGLEFKPAPPSKKPTPPWTGLGLSAESGVITVTSVIRNSPGYKSGIQVDDEVISIDGYRIKSSDLGSRIGKYKAGDEKEVLLVRRGKIISKMIKFGKKPSLTWTIAKIAKPTPAQTRNLNSWLANPKKK